MAKYKLVFRESVLKDFRDISKDRAGKILSRIEGLTDGPRLRGSIELAGQERYRLCQGVYRILYEIEDDELLITIVKASQRKDAYR
ncbi:MAG: type II toxin-antitoxin system RelE/ParE family toxin [Trueperaceae bacterium]